MTARFSRAAQQSIEFARKVRGHRPRLQLTEYRLNRTSSTSGVLNLLFRISDLRWPRPILGLLMNCPSCAIEMSALTLDGYMNTPVAIDLCTACQAFWFDKHESLRLAPGATLKLMKLSGESTARGKSIADVLHCPRCAAGLILTHDLQRNTRFTYWRCASEHGRFIRFFEFLKEKNFIRPLSPQQIEELRQNLQTVNCSNCGAPIDLTKAS